MKVRLYGFSLEAGNDRVNLGTLYDHLERQSGAADTTKSNERRIYFSQSADQAYARGLVVTVRNQKAFCKLIEERGSLVINVQSLRGEDKLMEFNFFLINKTNGLGLYQHYFHSCSLGTFGSYLRTDYRELSDASCQHEIRRLAAAGTQRAKRERAIRRSHRGGLCVATLVRAGRLAAVLREFRKIKSFEYEFAELDAIRDVAEPLSPYVRRRKEKVTFQQGADITGLANAIQRVVTDDPPRSGRVHVETDEGDPLSVRLSDIPENFGEYEYDAVAATLDNLDVRNFSDHETFRQMETVCDAHPEIFNARVRRE